MSAWIVSDDHVRLLAQAHALYGDEQLDLDELCTNLMFENVRSVDYRYDESNAMLPVDYSPVFGGENPIHFKTLALVSLHCYGYQSCEHPEWEESEAKRITDRLHDLIRETLTPGQSCDDDHSCLSLPGADDEPWGFELPYRRKSERATLTRKSEEVVG